MNLSRLKTFLTVATVLAVAVSAGAQSAKSNAPDRAADARAIQAVFAEYKDALLQSDGEKAADVVSARTIAFYAGIANHALTTPREKLAELDFISKLMVLRIRHEFTKAQVSEMTGRSLLVTGVNRGWISKSSVQNIEQLVNIKVGSSEASAAMSILPEVPMFQFLKESGRWKLNLVASFDLGNAAIREEVRKSGLTDDQFMIRILNSVSSKEVDERIFSPLK